MRAAVVRRPGAAPALDQFADPQPGEGVAVATLVAAALNPLDIAIVDDQIPFRRLELPYIAGYEAVVQLGDGTRCYLGGPPAPYGALAELVPVPDSAGFPVPAGLDPGLAAALGVTGIVGWVALDYRGHLQTGETVLVLGAGGAAGQLAVQSARILGAGRVVGAARGQAADRGADAVVDLAYDQAIDASLAAAAPGGYDVIVDFLWGVSAPYAMNHANLGAGTSRSGAPRGPCPRSARPSSATRCLRSWVRAWPPRPPKYAAPPTRAWRVTRPTGRSLWTWSKPGSLTSARPGSTSRRGHRASSWSRPEPSPGARRAAAGEAAIRGPAEPPRSGRRPRACRRSGADGC